VFAIIVVVSQSLSPDSARNGKFYRALFSFLLDSNADADGDGGGGGGGGGGYAPADMHSNHGNGRSHNGTNTTSKILRSWRCYCSPQRGGKGKTKAKVQGRDSTGVNGCGNSACSSTRAQQMQEGIDLRLLVANRHFMKQATTYHTSANDADAVPARNKTKPKTQELS
jgi:hypothetical protein